MYWAILDVGQSKRRRSGRKEGVCPRGHTDAHTRIETYTLLSGCCGMFGAVPRQIRAMLAVFDGQPGQTRPARHKLLRHMMSGHTHPYTRTHKNYPAPDQRDR